MRRPQRARQGRAARGRVLPEPARQRARAAPWPRWTPTRVDARGAAPARALVDGAASRARAPGVGLQAPDAALSRSSGRVQRGPRPALLPLLRRSRRALRCSRRRQGRRCCRWSPGRAATGATRAALARAPARAFAPPHRGLRGRRGQARALARPAGDRRGAAPRGARWRTATVLADRPDEVTSLVFLDFSQLLGLTRARRAGRRPDLRAVSGRPGEAGGGRRRLVGPGRHRERGAVHQVQMTETTDNDFLFTSESVTEGHPDKVADQISDGVLDAVLRDDPYGRVACETLVNTGPGRRLRRDLHRDLRRHPGHRARRRSATSATPTPTSASAATRARSSTRSTSSRPTSPRASTPRSRRAPTPPTTTSSTSPAPATRG